MEKLLVLYVFHVYNNRVKHFIENCIFKDENIDFILISNNCQEKIYYPEHVKFFLRKNIGYDFGGWSEALLTNNLYKNYDNFIFVNSSVTGPFLHSSYKGKWTDIYVKGLQNNIKLFGSTINTIENPLHKSHVQSYIFSMNITTLEFLIECEIFSVTNYTKTFISTVWDKEVLMSRKIIENLSKPKKLGRVKRLEDANDNYIEILKKNFPSNFNLKNMKIAIDCANGAGYKSAPNLLKSLGAKIYETGTANLIFVKNNKIYSPKE